MIEEIRPIPEGVFPPFIDGAEEQLNSIYVGAHQGEVRRPAAGDRRKAT